MHAHIAWLVVHRFGGKQARLCDAVGMAPAWLSLYKAGKNGRGKELDLSELDTRHSWLRRALERQGLPLETPAAAVPTNLPASGRGGAAEGGGAAETPQQPASKAAATAPLRAAILSANLREVQGAKEGGQVHITKLGIAVADVRWKMSRPGGGAPLFLRDGLRGQRAFAARQGSTMGGRSFEFWVEPLDARHDPAHHGGPVWVARELTGTLNLGQRIIGRWSQPGSAVHLGPSSPALLVTAISRHCGIGARINGMAFTGLIHKSVQELLDVAAESAGLMEKEAPATPASTFGARSGGLRGLKQGGSRLREVGDAAGIAFLDAMESIAPGDPEGAFAQLMLKPSFRNRFLASEWRDGLGKAAVQEQILRTPFVATFVKTYKELDGYRAKRQLLSLFAPFFPYAVTMQLFGVGRKAVHAARVHAGEYGGARPVPASLNSYRITPEAAEGVSAFVSKPDFTQARAPATPPACGCATPPAQG